MTKLEEAREKINSFDATIMEALQARMECVKDVVAYKKENNMQVFQPDREIAQRAHLKEQLSGTGYEVYLMNIFEEMLKNSKNMQKKILFNSNIFLIGFMGAGKSTIAKALCNLYGMEQVEMDALIEERQGISIAQIFAEYGEPYFRKLETELLMEFGEKTGFVVSCGGGVAMRQENVDHMKKNGHVVLLRALPETIYARVKDSTNRPLLNSDMSVRYITELMDVRRAKYEAAADLAVETDGKNANVIAEEIMDKLLKL